MEMQKVIQGVCEVNQNKAGNRNSKCSHGQNVNLSILLDLNNVTLLHLKFLKRLILTKRSTLWCYSNT